ncbi:CBL-interacting protein kinase 7 [Tasmannia lanceolata]|uniref:CBL-interacting protein kinase 7 n=1 Tax=Tasmannia lanceolata TaxID=3420 RepID=UPI004063BB0F
MAMDLGAEPTRPQTSPKVLQEKYELGRLLGRGTFAKVYYARSLASGTGVAIKVINKSKITNPTMELRIIREVSVMHRLRHPNIVKLHEVIATKSNIYLIMEHAKGGELFSKISNRRPLPESVARRYFHQLISALHFCHSNGVAHRDIKPQNLLLDNEGNLKISDFGLSALPEQLKDGLLHTACGTPAYTAPEVVRRKGYDGPTADAWSCGVVLFVLLAGFLPFDDSNIALMYKKIQRREFQFPSWISKSARRVISQLLDPNPTARITIEALMQVSWFKKAFKSIGQLGFDYSLESTQYGSCKLDSTMNAFDIISLSSGLDLSGLFIEGKRREKRFTTEVSLENIEAKLEECGEKLGYRVERTKEGIVGLVKGKLILSIDGLQVAPELFLVEVKVAGGDGLGYEEPYWEDLKDELQDIVLAWHNDMK